MALKKEWSYAKAWKKINFFTICFQFENLGLKYKTLRASALVLDSLSKDLQDGTANNKICRCSN